jgi:hypothetical protein
VSCTNAPWNSQYTSAGSPYNSNACSWACSTGYYLSGSRCAACSSWSCPVGKYATTCTPTADSSCQPCTNVPAYGVYTGAGQRGDPNSCETGCIAGYYKDGSICAGCKNLVFTLVPGGDNYASCDGVYTLDTRTINNKPLYINAPAGRFLAWNTGAWVLTGTQWLDGILSSQGYFGAFQANNGNGDPKLGWANYAVTFPLTPGARSSCSAYWSCPSGYYLEGAGCSSCENLVFSVKPGGDNYADCDGTYVIDSRARTINGKPLYINQAKYRFLAYSSSGAWVVTGLQWLDGLLGGGSFGGFHGNGGADPMVGWANYRVRKPVGC